MVHETHPQVFLISRPALNWDGIKSYLELVGGQAHSARMRPKESHGEMLVEFMGRLCYRSWDVGLNPNVTRIREDRREYLGNVLNSKHGSVIEHANYSFVFANVSRVFTHELVRHRAGTAFSQESMRFVRLDDIGFEHPAEIRHDPALLSEANDLLARMQWFQQQIAHKLEVDSLPFAEKKKITSSMRRYAPDGLSTHIGFTANLRTLRWLCQARTESAAEQEIRYVFGDVAVIMEREVPDLWQDFEVDEEGQWVPTNRKV